MLQQAVHLLHVGGVDIVPRHAAERRIVHVELKEDPRVKTYALGTGLIKRVAVAPADFPEGPRSD